MRGESAAPIVEPLGLFEYASMLYRHKLTLVCAIIAGVLVAWIVSLAQPRTYRAEASVEVQTPNEDFLNLRNLSPTAAPFVVSEESYVQTLMEALRQNWLIERTLRSLSLEARPELLRGSWLSGWRDSAQGAPGLSKTEPRPDPAQAIEALKASLSIQPVRRSRVIRISYESVDPEVAARVPNTLLRVFREHSLESRLAETNEIRSWLRSPLADLKARLDGAEAAFTQYMRESGLGFTPGRENLAEERLQLVQAELTKAEADRILKESLNVTGKSSEAGADTDVVRAYQIKLTELRRELADLSTLLRPESQKVVRLKAQIAEVEAAYGAEVARHRDRLSEDYTAARQREGVLAGRQASQAQLAADAAAKMVHYNTLKQRVESARQSYELMLQRSHEAQIASVIRPTNLRVLGEAQVPRRPFKPNFPLYAALGACSALLLAIGFVTVGEYGRPRLRGPGESEGYLRLPELGAIPAAPRLLPGVPRLPRLLSASQENRVATMSWEDRRSPVSESFRAAVFSLLSLRKDTASVGGRVIAVTSPLSMDGKTTVVSNLGIALSELGLRVLLMDGDLRRPRLHEIFNLSNDRGVTLLLNHSAIDEVPREELAYPTQVPNLFILPSGPPAADISRLLFSHTMAELIQRVRGEFDFVLIDTPPALDFVDARMLALCTDGVVVVLRANRTDDRTALATLQGFLMDRIPVLGTILNQCDFRAGTVSRYGRYRYERNS